ncbi:hypothetical protein BZA77DRAFT_111691 [Pyronema omphalodes]|nr:hypothetical protein BZA77DRAFT_111691 [Pyronema omphalodes]
MSPAKAVDDTIRDPPGDSLIATPVSKPNSIGKEQMEITKSLSALSIEANDTSKNTEDAAATKDTTAANEQQNGSKSSAENCASTSASSATPDRSPSANTEASKPTGNEFSQQLPGIVNNDVDRPDPRLIDALEHPRDRLFVIKLEKELIAFVENKTCDVFDMPQINSYHRLLAHKMAEYYRLTHVADATGGSVRMFRGQAARIPPTLLSSWPSQTQQIQKAVAEGTMPKVTLMKRGSGKSGNNSRASSKGPNKDGSETSSDNGTGTPSGNAKPTRDEREALYEAARARIFSDFVETPPETPPPDKNQKRRNNKQQDDDFSGRSQFYPVMPPQFYPNQCWGEPQMQQQFIPPQVALPHTNIQPPPPQQQHHQPQQQVSQGGLRFNPAANFTPIRYPQQPPHQPTNGAAPYARPLQFQGQQNGYGYPQHGQYNGQQFTPGQPFTPGQNFPSQHQQHQQMPHQQPQFSPQMTMNQMHNMPHNISGMQQHQHNMSGLPNGLSNGLPNGMRPPMQHQVYPGPPMTNGSASHPHPAHNHSGSPNPVPNMPVTGVNAIAGINTNNQLNHNNHNQNHQIPPNMMSSGGFPPLGNGFQRMQNQPQMVPNKPWNGQAWDMQFRGGRGG